MRLETKLFSILFVCFAAISSSDGGESTAEITFITHLTKKLNTLCPDKSGKKRVPPEFCTCDNSPDRKTYPPWDLNDVFGLLFDLLGCAPGDCMCKGSTEYVEARPVEMQKLLSMCPKGEMEKCVCAGDDEEVMEWPFEMKKLFFECQPVKCKCKKDKDYKPLTVFGCAKGGMASCKDKRMDLVCSDGTHIEHNEVMKARVSEKCICEDGKTPRCNDETKDFIRCPVDGGDINFSIGTPGKYYENCKKG